MSKRWSIFVPVAIVAALVAPYLISLYRQRGDPQSIEAVTITSDVIPICTLPASIKKLDFQLGEMCVLPDSPEIICFKNTQTRIRSSIP